MTYKDCIHNEVCIFRKKDCAENCKQFKDKARFVELPCKVGEKIWLIQWWVGCKVKTLEKPMQRTVMYLSIGKGDVGLHFKDGAIPERNIGDLAFLTREEAEKALEKQNE